jgi:hypothetical protein
VGALIASALGSQSIASPVLVLTYTNHALDSFLVKILDNGAVGVEKMLRLGGRYRDEAVEPMLVENKRKGVAKTGQGEMYRILRERDGALQAANEAIGTTEDWIMSCDDPSLQSLQLTEQEQQWYATLPKAPPLAKVQPSVLWASGKMDAGHFKDTAPPMKAERDALFAMDPSARKAIIDRAKATCAQQRVDEFTAAAERLRLADDAVHAERVRADMDVASTQLVIGCTTSYAAKAGSLLSTLVRPKTIIIEEAAEIHEAHVLATLVGTCERLIMIGDHKQLRPKVSTYKFEEASGHGLNLDISMFERLVIGKFRLEQLATQQRMFPRLAKIVREIAYPHLLDGLRICPDGKLIPGFNGQLLFLDHRELEDGRADRNESVTKSNPHEATITAGIVRHLLRQKRPVTVTPGDIVVLTPYLGQVSALVREMRLLEVPVSVGATTAAEVRLQVDADDVRSDDENDDAKRDDKTSKTVRISTVDNFQGEEAKYIVVSLVRSNKYGDTGWLKQNQRVTVLMSRAQRGMILVGNLQTLQSGKGKDLWTKVASGCEVVTALPLKCHCGEKAGSVRFLADSTRFHPTGGAIASAAARKPAKSTFAGGLVTKMTGTTKNALSRSSSNASKDTRWRRSAIVAISHRTTSSALCVTSCRKFRNTLRSRNATLIRSFAPRNTFRSWNLNVPKPSWERQRACTTPPFKKRCTRRRLCCSKHRP